ELCGDGGDCRARLFHPGRFREPDDPSTACYVDPFCCYLPAAFLSPLQESLQRDTQENRLNSVLLTANRRFRPLGESVAILDDLDGHPVVALECLFCVGSKGFHFPLSIFCGGDLICLE